MKYCIGFLVGAFALSAGAETLLLCDDPSFKKDPFSVNTFKDAEGKERRVSFDANTNGDVYLTERMKAMGYDIHNITKQAKEAGQKVVGEYKKKLSKTQKQAVEVNGKGLLIHAGTHLEPHEDKLNPENKLVDSMNDFVPTTCWNQQAEILRHTLEANPDLTKRLPTVTYVSIDVQIERNTHFHGAGLVPDPVTKALGISKTGIQDDSLAARGIYDLTSQCDYQCIDRYTGKRESGNFCRKRFVLTPRLNPKSPNDCKLLTSAEIASFLKEVLVNKGSKTLPATMSGQGSSKASHQ